MTNSKILIVVAGYAGSGKTELGKFLCHLTNWPLLDKDTVTRPLLECLLQAVGLDPDDRQSALYAEQLRPLEYKCMMDAAFENLSCGTSAIVSAPFLGQITDGAWARTLDRRCSARGVRFELVWVACDEETMRDHLRSRNAGRDRWKLTHWPEYMATIDADFRPSWNHHVVNNSASADTPLFDQARDLVARIGVMT